jgi:hypothetical protein
MLQFANSTPLKAALFPYTDSKGIDHLAITVKGTWTVVAGGEPQLADEQEPIRLLDQLNGPDPSSSIRAEADTGWPKSGTDVALSGFAYPRRAGDSVVDVGLEIGALRKVVRVFGNRRWQLAVGGWRATAPEPFDRLPLLYERAYGGRDTTARDPAKHGWEARNPVGIGFSLSEAPERLGGVALPNLEDPRALISSWKDRPAPAGFGLLHRHWMPRLRLAGTYDERWRTQRAPLLPEDFDERFFNAAAADLVARPHLRGGEAVLVTQATRRDPLRFSLPRRELGVTAIIKGEVVRVSPRLDTVTIDAEAGRVVMVWRAGIRCPRALLLIDKIFVKEVA